MKSYKFIISGRVQGVFYRATVAKKAQKEGFNGYIKNLQNTDVEAAVTCKEQEVEKFIAILQKGSFLSKVTDIKQIPIKEQFQNGFEIKYD